MDFMEKVSGNEDTQYNKHMLDFDITKHTNEENEQNCVQPKSMDDMIASILKDLEIAEVSLQSTSHLFELPTDSDPEPNSEYKEKSDTSPIEPITDLNPISCDSDANNKEESTSTSLEKNGNDCDLTCDKPELKQFSSHEEPTENIRESPGHFEETKPSEEARTNVGNIEGNIVGEIMEEGFKEMKPQNTSDKTKDKAALKILLPSSNPYINFIQDFQSKYKGNEVTPSMLVALASAKWRKMSKEEKRIYKNLNCEKNKQIEKLKKYAKSLKMSEDSLFQCSHFL